MTGISAYFLAYLPANIWGLFLLFLVFVSLLLLFFQLQKTQIIIYILLIWFPLESLVLRWTPIEYYSYIKYFPEVLLYSVFLFAWAVYVKNRGKILPPNPLNKWLFGFLAIAVASLILNWYSPMVWILGLRQLLRFSAVFFLALFLRYTPRLFKKILYLAGAMFILEAVFGVIQYLAGGSLDKYLFSTQVVTVGNLALLGGIEQSWTPGTRIFATLGRYDQFGSFLALGLALFFPFLYFLKNQSQKIWLGAGLLITALGLVLSASRASWLGAAVAVIVVGDVILKDKKVWIISGVLLLFLSCYLIGFALSQNNLFSIPDKPTQSFAERIFGAVSISAWRNSYEGYGRFFFIINTPRTVVMSAPFFGVGPGNFGGGVAAALLNTGVYDRLRLPFGIQNLYGQIDNSWFSVWGEFGTLGLICFISMFAVLIKQGLKINRERNDWEKTLGLSLAGATIVVMVMGFFGPYFEFRSLMFYYWLFAGMTLSISKSYAK